MSSLSAVLSLSSFNLLFVTQVLTVLTSAIKHNEYFADTGKNISLPCSADGNIIWVKDNGNYSSIIQAGKFLVLRNLTSAESGLYICFISINIRANSTATILVKNDNKTHFFGSSKNRTFNGFIATFDSNKLENRTNNSNTNVRNDYQDRAKDEFNEQEYQAIQKIKLVVRTPPGPVTQLYFKASTILGFLIWRFDRRQSGGYPIRSFTAEIRQVFPLSNSNASEESEWVGIDPRNIAPNVRQMEIYRLQPNTTYDFHIWANNFLGQGEVIATTVTTLPEYKEEAHEDCWDGIELIPNIVLNPGFNEMDETNGLPPFKRTVIFDDDDYSSDESDHEPAMAKFKRKVSVFFTGPTIKRI